MQNFHCLAVLLYDLAMNSYLNGVTTPFVKLPLGSATILVGMLCVSGCALGNVGMIGAHIQDFTGGQTVEIHVAGFHLRTRSDDAGASLGYTRRTYVFGAATSLPTGWHFFHIPLPSIDVIALDKHSLGVDISSVEPFQGLTIGYDHTQLRARVRIDSSIYLEYGGPTSVVVKHVQCKEHDQCNAL